MGYIVEVRGKVGLTFPLFVVRYPCILTLTTPHWLCVGLLTASLAKKVV
jgi:hypothetical protein